jgi:hypothetical protein
VVTAMELEMGSEGHELKPSPKHNSTPAPHPSEHNRVQQVSKTHKETLTGPEKGSVKRSFCPWILMISGLMERVQQALKIVPRSCDQKITPARATSSSK